LHHHERRALERPVTVGRENQLPPPPARRKDAFRCAAHDLQPLRINVEHGQFVDGKPVGVGGEPLDELRRVRAAGPYDGDLHAHETLRLPTRPNPRVKCASR
jgi:hypothetical protein